MEVQERWGHFRLHSQFPVGGNGGEVSGLYNTTLQELGFLFPNAVNPVSAPVKSALNATPLGGVFPLSLALSHTLLFPPCLTRTFAFFAASF